MGRVQSGGDVTGRHDLGHKQVQGKGGGGGGGGGEWGGVSRLMLKPLKVLPHCV